MKSAFEKIACGLADAIAFADSGRNHVDLAFADGRQVVRSGRNLRRATLQIIDDSSASPAQRGTLKC